MSKKELYNKCLIIDILKLYFLIRMFHYYFNFNSFLSLTKLSFKLKIESLKIN